MPPHRSRSWLHADPEDPDVFGPQVGAVGDLSEQAGRRAEPGIHLVSTDEKTGIQAWERLSPDLPPGPGRVQWRESESRRHGTLCRTANLEIWCGWSIAATRGATRTEADFVAHVEPTGATDPEAGWVFIVDHRNTHPSESLVLGVAQTCGIAEDLGANGRRGVLKSPKSRASFRSDAGHRIRFVYTPKHTSWLHQMETWFSILVRKLLRRCSFRSLEDLEARIVAFIDYFNRTMAKPIRWLYSVEPKLANGTG